MEADWEKLKMDCSWKRLQAVAFRNVPGSPQPLSLTVVSVGSGVVFHQQHAVTCNPTWTLPAIRLKDFPVIVQLKGENGEEMWAEPIDIRVLYFVTSDLKDIEQLPSMAVLFLFQNEGYYTLQSQAAAACSSAKNNSQQIKISVTTLAQPREVAFSRLQTDYQQ